MTELHSARRERSRYAVMSVAGQGSWSILGRGKLTVDQVSSADEVVLALETRADLLRYPDGAVVVRMYQREQVRDAQRAESVVAYC